MNMVGLPMGLDPPGEHVSGGKEEEEPARKKISASQRSFMAEIGKNVDKSVKMETDFFEPRIQAELLKYQVTGPAVYFLKAVKVWAPLKMFAKEVIECYACPNCKSRVDFQEGNWRERRVLGETDYFYLLHKQYKCSSCRRTFMNSHTDVLKQLPDVVRMRFGITFRSKSAATLDLVGFMDDLKNKLGATVTARIITQQYVRRFENLRESYRERIKIGIEIEKEHPSDDELRREGYIVKSQEQKERFGEANTVMSCTGFTRQEGKLQIKVKGIGNEKIHHLKSLGEKIGDLPNLQQFKEKGIQTAVDLASISVEKLTLDELELLIDKKDGHRMRSAKEVRRTIIKARTWIQNSLEFFNLQFHNSIDEVRQSYMEEREIDEHNRLNTIKLKETPHPDQKFRKQEAERKRKDRYMEFVQSFGEYEDSERYNGTRVGERLVKYLLQDHAEEKGEDMEAKGGKRKRDHVHHGHSYPHAQQQHVNHMILPQHVQQHPLAPHNSHHGLMSKRTHM
mmetsp:Transcript_5349/g.8270  ORF Transcript_5349/g.8270 Transcript_5349/m.8270 type:complete len:509 (-) Transcript_5349:3127-4653(-)